MNSLFICSLIIESSDKYLNIFNDWINLINNFEKKNWNIYWLIQNIKLTDDIKNKIEDIIENKNIEVIFFENNYESKLNYYKIFFQNITSYILSNNIIKNRYILWLENDWLLLKDDINLINIINNIDDNVYFSFINKKKILDFSPFIMTYKSWINYYYKILIDINIKNNELENIDPRYYIKLKLMEKNSDFNNKISYLKILENKDEIKELNEKEYFTIFNNEDIIDNKNFIKNKEIKDKFNKNFLIIYFNKKILINYKKNLIKINNSKKEINEIEEYEINNDYNTIKVLKNGIGIFNILYLCDKNIFLNKMSRVRFNAMNALNKINNVIYWGPNWNKYDINKTVDENIRLLKIKIHFIIYYKPEILKDIKSVTIPKIITYNEMWDENLTINEINNSSPDLIICHHKNDMEKYLLEYSKKITYPGKFVHIPHSC
jgi:hypothetical protein